MDGGKTSPGIVEGQSIVLRRGDSGEEVTQTDRPAGQQPIQRALVEAFYSTRREVKRPCPQVSEATETIASGCINKILLPSTARLKDRLYTCCTRGLGGSKSQLSVVSWPKSLTGAWIRYLNDGSNRGTTMQQARLSVILTHSVQLVSTVSSIFRQNKRDSWPARYPDHLRAGLVEFGQIEVAV